MPAVSSLWSRLKDLGWYHAGTSEHSSLLAAIKDLYEPVEMWERIGRCDVNQNWSASIVQVRGELKAYFCEVAASFDLARRGEHGLDVSPGWWARPMSDFHCQVDRFCPGCGIPAKVKGHFDHEEIDTYSMTNADIAQKSATRKKRKIVEVDRTTFQTLEDVPVTSYSNYLRGQSEQGPRIFVVTPYYQEPLEVLRRCHESVMGQAVGAQITHVMVADGHPRPEIDSWNVTHIRLPKAHGDNGNTPRAVGTTIAETNGADFIAFLDADNWYYPDHLASMLEGLRQTGASVACAWRDYFGPDGPADRRRRARRNGAEARRYQLHHGVERCVRGESPLGEHAPGSVALVRSYLLDRDPPPALPSVLHAQEDRRLHDDLHAALRRPELAGPGQQQDAADDEMMAYLRSLEGIQETVRKLGFWPLAI